MDNDQWNEWHRLTVGAVGLQMITVRSVPGSIAGETGDRDEMRSFLGRVLPAIQGRADQSIAATIASAPTVASTGAAGSERCSPAGQTTGNAISNATSN